jgi:ring-1,2-phenylacetyl-CoA epoxidase subunit PaaC
LSFDNAYDALAQEHGDEARWAYGTGFVDPLSTVDTAIPSTVDRVDLATYCLMLGDDALILSQRLSEWCARAPELEEDVALANIALDLLGQARLLLSRAGFVEGRGRDEDALAYLREPHEFRNVQLSEVDCGPGAGGDFATTIARLLVFSSWRLALLERLTGSRDPVLAAVAAKGVKELAYHRDHAVQWTLRLGDGTPESHRRMDAGLDVIWPLVGELFVTHPVELRLAARGVAVDPATLRASVDEVLDAVLPAATLAKRQVSGAAALRGRNGVHTDAMAPLLNEMQSVARAHQGASW